MMSKKFFYVCGLALFSMLGYSQEVEQTEMDDLRQRTEQLESVVNTLKKIKISGYVQGQFQYGQKDASLKVGGPNENMEESFYRFGMRYGCLKIAYDEGLASAVYQIDITERGVRVRDMYLSIKDPWLKSNAFRVGIFDRPFGYEVGVSTAVREAPERAAIIQALFPSERDLGAMFSLQAPKTSSWSVFKLDAGLFAGNAVNPQFDNHMDFIGHLTYNKTIGSEAHIGAGVSYYKGKVYQGTANVYTMQDNGFILNNDPLNKGEHTNREYIGFDARVAVETGLGITHLRSEYIIGEQPGSIKSTKSPSSSSLPNYDTYIRNISGGYVEFVQDLKCIPLSPIVKYDWYNPNTKVKGSEVGLNNTSKSDLFQSTVGMGLVWRISKQFRMQGYYELTSYRKTNHLELPKSNIFTLRLQTKF